LHFAVQAASGLDSMAALIASAAFPEEGSGFPERVGKAAGVPPVEADRVGGLQPPDRPAQVCAWRFHQQMVVVRHQAEGVEKQAVLFDALAERLEEALSILVIPKDTAALVALGRDVIHGAWIFNSNGTRHRLFLRLPREACQVCGVDPIGHAPHGNYSQRMRFICWASDPALIRTR
jgi:hypothetical protein